MKKMTKVSYVSDVYDIAKNKVEVEVIDKYGELLLIPVDLKKMGLEKSDWEFEMSKLLCRMVDTYARNNSKTPPVSYITKKLDKIEYFTIGGY